ncbi:MAG TPA: hypothetical protein VJZ91_14200 [Blastocatellia bacterium]|nr:hypothetical protein [Blastocatellia bacterium]
MSTSAHPAAQGGESGQQQQHSGGSVEQQPRPGRRPRAGKDDAKTLELDFTSNEELLADLRALAQVMKFDLNVYLLSAIEAKYKADTEKARKDFNAKAK